MKIHCDHVHTIADPFLIRKGHEVYLFAEQKRARGKGEIIAFRWEGNGLVDLGVVLATPFHVSYPQVICHGDSYFMVPETSEAGQVSLYRANRFPDGWAKVATLVSKPLSDATVFHEAGVWWMLGSVGNDELSVFASKELFGPWLEMSYSPIKLGIRASRSAGAIIRVSGRLIRPVQDCAARYGGGLNLFEINQLNETGYSQRLVLEDAVPKSRKWNELGSHHISVLALDGENLIAVDGQYRDHPLNRLFGMIHRRSD